MTARRILLIEDNEQNRYLATFLLQARGWEVVHASDGPSGIALAGIRGAAVRGRGRPGTSFHTPHACARRNGRKSSCPP